MSDYRDTDTGAVPDAPPPVDAGAVPDAAPAVDTAPALPPSDDGVRLNLTTVNEWHRVSPKYVMVEIVGTVIFLVIVCAVAGFLWLALDQTWAAVVGGALALITLVSLAFEPRRVRSIGYQLRADDLLFRRGIMYQRFVSVPYGRMQLVDITRGPVARWLGLADLKFVTAAAASAVSIPGLAEVDAEALRDRLVELAESRRAGL